MELKEFTEHDWDAWAGAESPSGSEPLVAEARVSDWPEDVVEPGQVIVIVDNNGVFVQGIDLWMTLKCNFVVGCHVVEGLWARESVSYTDLRKAGFEVH